MFCVAGRRHPERWRSVPATPAAVLASLAILFSGCAAQTSSAPTSGETHATTSESLSCPGERVAVDDPEACPAPSAVRAGRACGKAQARCPSVDLVEGSCTCEGSPASSAGAFGGVWRCDAAPPADYDPFPDCPDEGVLDGDACYANGNTCIPTTAGLCFTSRVPLCTCKGHSWRC